MVRNRGISIHLNELLYSSSKQGNHCHSSQQQRFGNGCSCNKWKGATRLILKAEDGTVLKEYHLPWRKESTQPVAAENSAQTLRMLAINYCQWSTYHKIAGLSLAVQWDAIPECATLEGNFWSAWSCSRNNCTTKGQSNSCYKGNQSYLRKSSNNATDLQPLRLLQMIHKKRFSG